MISVWSELWAVFGTLEVCGRNFRGVAGWTEFATRCMYKYNKQLIKVTITKGVMIASRPRVEDLNLYHGVWWYLPRWAVYANGCQLHVKLSVTNLNILIKGTVIVPSLNNTYGNKSAKSVFNYSVRCEGGPVSAKCGLVALDARISWTHCVWGGVISGMQTRRVRIETAGTGLRSFLCAAVSCP